MNNVKLNIKSVIPQFKKNGYVIIPGVLDENEVLLSHKEATSLMEKNEDITLTPTEFMSLLNTRKTLFKPIIIEHLLQLFNPYYMYPNFTVRNNLYIQWHTDDFYLDAPLEENIQNIPEFVMCNIYLQNNSEITGGGIDVIPGSHHLSMVQKQQLISKDDFNYVTVKSKKGDLLLFDYRIIHRGTPPIEETYPNRLAIQWTVSRSDRFSGKLLQYLLRRRHEKLHLSDHTKKRALRYFNDIANIKNTSLFPKEYLASMKQYNIQCVCVETLGENFA